MARRRNNIYRRALATFGAEKTTYHGARRIVFWKVISTPVGMGTSGEYMPCVGGNRLVQAHM